MAIVKIIRDEDGDLWISDGGGRFEMVSDYSGDNEHYIKMYYGVKAETEVEI